jgi:hypothetical protein
MIILLNTDSLLINLGATVATNQAKLVVSWRDRTSTTFTAGRTLSVTNNTTPVDISGSPASGAQRIVDYINFYNDDTAPIEMAIALTDGVNTNVLYRTVVAVGQTVTYTNESGWKNTSNELTPILNNRKVLSGALFETFDRDLCNEVNTSVLSSGRLSLQAIWLPAGTTISSISFFSATSAANAPTNQLFGLFDSSRNLLRSSVNDGATAWAANSLKTLSLTSTFTTTYSGIHYLGIMVTATTVPTLKGNTAKVGGQLNAAAPSMGGTSNTGLTTALPATANAPGTVTTSFWGCVS